MKGFKTLAIDFDGVIHDSKMAKSGHLGEPMEGAKEALDKLEPDYKLIIYTQRAATDREHVMNWLDFFHIPYHGVTAIKPPADYYIDDKAIKFESWKQVMEVLDGKRT